MDVEDRFRDVEDLFMDLEDAEIEAREGCFNGEVSFGKKTIVQARGVYRATILTLALEADRVRLMVDRGLDLAPRSGLHPVVFTFGRQEDVRTVFPFTLNYLETIVAVPFVSLGGRGPLVYPARLFLDSLVPTIAGWVDGFPKKLARLEATPDSFRVTTANARNLLVEVETKPSGERAPASSPHFAAYEEIFGQPLVGRFLLTGPFLTTSFEWHWERGTVEPVDAEFHIARSFVPGLPQGPFSIARLGRAPLGAFRCEVPWTLRGPGPLSLIH